MDSKDCLVKVPCRIDYNGYMGQIIVV